MPEPRPELDDIRIRDWNVAFIAHAQHEGDLVDHELTARVSDCQVERIRRLGGEMPDLGVIIETLEES